jgi:hypothetical protein
MRWCKFGEIICDPEIRRDFENLGLGYGFSVPRKWEEETRDGSGQNWPGLLRFEGDETG